MKEHNMTVDQAKQFCWTKIKEVVAKYLAVVERTRSDEPLSLNLRRYIEAVLYSVSGNLACSLTCPRYHAEAEYNDLQLKRMKYGVKKYTSRHQAIGGLGKGMGRSFFHTPDSRCRSVELSSWGSKLFRLRNIA